MLRSSGIPAVRRFGGRSQATAFTESFARPHEVTARYCPASPLASLSHNENRVTLALEKGILGCGLLALANSPAAEAPNKARQEQDKPQTWH